MSPLGSSRASSALRAELEELAERVVARTIELGADEASASVSAGTHVAITRRGGQVEQATEATTRGLVVSLQAADRHTSNSTSDLRPDALEAFLRRCVASAAFLEPEPAYALPDAALCGSGATEAELQLSDPAWDTLGTEERSLAAARLEEAIVAASAGQEVASCAAHLSDAAAESVRVMSNGFRGSLRSGWFVLGGEMTLRDGDKRPEASAYYASRHLADLPAVTQVAAAVVERARARLGQAPAPSGTYPMVVENRVAGHLLGVLGGPLSGGALHHDRSCLAGKLGTKLGSSLLTIVDDPLLPRGLGSRPWDGDGLIARPRTIFERGVLRSYDVSVYYGRKLGMEPTSGSRSNWVVPAGDRPWQEVARAWPEAILVTGFLGGNSNGTTGDFSFGIRGALLRDGEVVRPVSEMNVTGNLLTVFGRLVALGDDPWPWGSIRAPTLFLEGISFSGS